MRVLQVINSLILAGAEMLLRQMAPRLREAGIDTTLAVLKTLDSPLEHELRDAGFRFLPIESDIYSPGHIRKLAAYVNEFDLVHAHLFPAQLWAPMAAALARSKVALVTTEHSTQNRRRKPWFRPFDRWMYQRYRGITCNSEATRDELARWVPEVSDRLTVIPNGVPLQQFRDAQPANREKLVPGRAGQTLAIFVARMQPQKDHVTVLRALRRVPQVDLLLVGDGETRPVLEEMAQELGMGERVHFLGRRNDIPQLLRMCDLYVHASVSEGFGIAVVEAMAAGLPVVGSDVPGMGDICRGAALLFPAGDEEAMSQHIRALAQSPEMCKEYRALGLQRAQRYSIENTVRGWIGFYESVLGNPGKKLDAPTSLYAH